jgi:hypothetical protein
VELPHFEDAQASPHDAPWLADEKLPYWKPTLGSALGHLGWNWLWFIPAGVVGVALFAGALNHRIWWLMASMMKLVVVVVAGTVAAGVRAIRDAARARPDPFCIHCGYSLIGLPEGHKCPECGVPFLHSMINEYRRDPDRFVQRVRLRNSVPAAGPVLVVERKVATGGTGVVAEGSGTAESVTGGSGTDGSVPVRPARRRSRDGT